MSSPTRSKTTHSIIERIRREKAAKYFEEMITLLPLPENVKKTKVNILDNIINFLKTSPRAAETNVNLSNERLGALILRSLNIAQIVFDCNTGIISFVSNEVQALIGYSKFELVNTNFYQYLHPDDVAVIANQLSQPISDTQLLDHNSSTVRSEPQSGKYENRRAFLFRMKTKNSTYYSSMSASGFLKTNEITNITQFTGVLSVYEKNFGATNKNNNQVSQFTTRHAENKMILNVDPDITKILGYKPSEMLGRQMDEFCMPNENCTSFTQLFQTLMNNEKQGSKVTGLLLIKGNGNFVYEFEVELSTFVNPCGNKFEFVVAKYKLNQGPIQFQDAADHTFNPLMTSHQLIENEKLDETDLQDIDEFLNQISEQFPEFP